MAQQQNLNPEQRRKARWIMTDIFKTMRGVVMVCSMRAIINLQRERLQRLTERLAQAQGLTDLSQHLAPWAHRD